MYRLSYSAHASCEPDAVVAVSTGGGGVGVIAVGIAAGSAVSVCAILSRFFAWMSAWTSSMVRTSFLLALGTVYWLISVATQIFIRYIYGQKK